MDTPCPPIYRFRLSLGSITSCTLLAIHPYSLFLIFKKTQVYCFTGNSLMHVLDYSIHSCPNAGHGGVKDTRQPQISQNQAVRKQKQEGAP